MPEERRLVTLLFADIVGSTHLTGAYDPEIVRGTLSDVFDRVRPEIAERGGTIEKFIGDAVMAVFGVPSAHDDDAERAVRAAFAIRDLIAHLSGPLEVEVRIGIASGEAVTRTDAADQRLVTGIAVHLAQRLQAAAAPGEILVSDLAHRLTETAVRYGPSRTVEARGIGHVNAWRAEALFSAAPGARGRPEGMRAPMLGRDVELARLRDLAARVDTTRRPMLITVVGPAGSGKTRLAEEFLAGVDASRILRGRCLPYGEGATAYPIEEMLRNDARVEPTDDRAAAAAKVRARVAEVVGAADDLDAVQRRVLVLAGVASASDVLPEVAVEDAAEELRWAFRRHLERRAAAGPAVLVFEDIHWAAPPVLDLIEHIAEWARAPLLILCLARPELRDARPSWPSARTPSAVIDLKPLDADVTGELVSALLGTDPASKGVREEVFSRSEGNPLYVEEFVRTLLDTGSIFRDGGTWIMRPFAKPMVPETLQGLIAARLDRLSSPAKRSLQEAAVIGRAFSHAALAALHDGPLADELRESLASDLLEETEAWAADAGAAYRFRHVLFRDIAYAMLSKADRVGLHDRYRQWLEDTTGERRDELIEVLADHADQAYRLAAEIRSREVLRLARLAFDRLRAAADRANDRGDLRSSLGLWERADATGQVLDLSNEERVSFEAAHLLVRTSVEHGDDLWADVSDLLDRARDVPPTEPFVRLLIAEGRRSYASSVEDSARLMREAYRAAKTIGDHELITHALLQLPVVARAAGDFEELDRMREEALRYAKAHGVTRELSACLRAVATSAFYSGAFTRGATLLDEAQRAAREQGSKTAEFAALSSRTEVATWTGPWDVAIAHARRLEPLAGVLATAEASATYLNLLGVALFEAGDLPAARAAHNAALGIAEPESFEQVDSVFDLVLTLVALGEIREARRLYELVERVDLPWQNFHAMNAVIAASLHSAEGYADLADMLFRRGIAIFEEATISPTRWRWAQTLYAEFLLRHGRHQEARALLLQVRDFFSDPLAAPRRARIDTLLATTQEIRA